MARKKLKVELVSDSNEDKKKKKVVRRRKRSSWLANLPREILEYIFCRLSVKNIVQLRFVSKNWYEILTHPIFISMHYDWWANKQSEYLIFHYGCQISRLDKCFDFKEKMKFPITSSAFMLVGSLDGLVCMTSKRQIRRHYFPSTYIWNPCMRAYKKLPDIMHPKYLVYACCISAFGYDSQTNDYKVFHTVRESLTNNKEDDVVFNRLYSLKKNSWNVIKSPADHDATTFPSGISACRTYFNGAFYWLSDSKNSTGSRFIMWFDFCDKTIRRTRLPIDYSKETILMSLGSLKNSLVLYVSTAAREHEDILFGPCRIDVWAMKKLSSNNDNTETSWSWDIQLSVAIASYIPCPLRNGLNGEIIMFKYFCLKKLQWCYRLGVYDFNKPSTIQEVDTKVRGNPTDNEFLRVENLFTYSESLLVFPRWTRY